MTRKEVYFIIEEDSDKPAHFLITDAKIWDRDVKRAIGAEYLEAHVRRIAGVPFGVVCDDMGRINGRKPTGFFSDGYPEFVGSIAIYPLDSCLDYKPWNDAYETLIEESFKISTVLFGRPSIMFDRRAGH